MNGSSKSVRYDAGGTHTHALFGPQSHSIEDNNVALFSPFRAQTCSANNEVRRFKSGARNNLYRTQIYLRHSR
jgi:hypothetical protein